MHSAVLLRVLQLARSMEVWRYPIVVLFDAHLCSGSFHGSVLSPMLQQGFQKPQLMKENADNNCMNSIGLGICFLPGNTPRGS